MESFSNYLYQHPDLYDQVFPDRTSSAYCLGVIARHAPGKPSSLLDFGCGTGSTLEVLAQTIPDCVGLDLLEPMVLQGRKTRPRLDLRVADFRTAKLGRTFDVLGCFGWAFSYLLSDEDVKAGLQAFARHAHPGSLLAFDCGQAEAYLAMAELPSPRTEIQVPGFTASAIAKMSLDRDRLILTRERTWTLPDGETAEDYCQYRLHRPADLKHLLEAVGFEVKEMAGDPSGRLQAEGERTLYVAAIKT